MFLFFNSLFDRNRCLSILFFFAGWIIETRRCYIKIYIQLNYFIQFHPCQSVFKGISKSFPFLTPNNAMRWTVNINCIVFFRCILWFHLNLIGNIMWTLSNKLFWRWLILSCCLCNFACLLCYEYCIDILCHEYCIDMIFYQG